MGPRAAARDLEVHSSPTTVAAFDPQTRTELGASPSPQLYNLATDPGETKNVAPEHPDRVADLSRMLVRIKSSAATRR